MGILRCDAHSERPRSFGEQRHQRLRDIAAAPAFVDDEHAPTARHRFEKRSLRQRRKPTQIDDAQIDSALSQRLLRLPREVMSVAVSNDSEVRDAAMDSTSPNAMRSLSAG